MNSGGRYKKVTIENELSDRDKEFTVNSCSFIIMALIFVAVATWVVITQTYLGFAISLGLVGGLVFSWLRMFRAEVRVYRNRK
jgi:predicted membrane metal-binding protein